MIDRPYCKQHYSECICSRCKYDKEDCCGRRSFQTYMCPFNSCGEFKPKPKEREPAKPPEPDRERGS